MHLACARIGAVLVNVNPAYRSYDLAFVLRKSRMKALFLWEKDKRSDYRAIVDEAMAGQTLALEHIVYFGTDDWGRMLAKGEISRRGG
jgi:fatty-acyl-CoA synthase